MVKNFFRQGEFTLFMSKNLQIWDHFFPTLFPKDSEKSKKFGHSTSGSGGKSIGKLCIVSL